MEFTRPFFTRALDLDSSRICALQDPSSLDPAHGGRGSQMRWLPVWLPGPGRWHECVITGPSRTRARLVTGPQHRQDLPI
jgi:hypothetical protein